MTCRKEQLNALADRCEKCHGEATAPTEALARLAALLRCLAQGEDDE